MCVIVLVGCIAWFLLFSSICFCWLIEYCCSCSLWVFPYFLVLVIGVGHVAVAVHFGLPFKFLYWILFVIGVAPKHLLHLVVFFSVWMVLNCSAPRLPFHVYGACAFVLLLSEGSTSLPGGNQVDGLPPASSYSFEVVYQEYLEIPKFNFARPNFSRRFNIWRVGW